MADAAVRSFDAELARALASLGAAPSEPMLDATLDARAVRAALGGLAEGEAVVLRAGAALAPPPDPAYAAVPRDPWWVRIERGQRAVRLAPLRLAAESPARAAELRAVACESEVIPCCDGAACTAEKTRARAWLVLDAPEEGAPERLLLAESTSSSAADARADAFGAAAAVAAAAGVPLEGEPPAPDRPPGGEAEPRAALSRARLARYALRDEGGRVVLRDHASAGPRASARRSVIVGLGLLGVAVTLWALLWREASARGASSVAIVLGASAAVVSLTAYAFLGVARFAARYAARSAPLLALSPGRFVVLPWVSRSGAVDLRPEGRFGAAIPIAELREVRAVPREGRTAVELDSDHGPIDAVVTADGEVAAFWAEALRRALADAGHPDPKASARQRARAKGRG